MTDTHVVSALRDKRAHVLGHIRDLEKKLLHHRANLAHIDAALLLFEPERDPNAIPARRTYRRSGYFAPKELPRLCLDALRAAKGKEITTAEVAEAVMAAKQLDASDLALARIMADRVGAVLRGLEKQGNVAKSGNGRNVRWQLT